MEKANSMQLQVRELKAVQDRIKGLQTQEKAIKSAILENMRKKDFKSLAYQFENEGFELVTTRTQRTTYDFDVKELKRICAEKGDKGLFNDCTNKTFSVRLDVMQDVLKKHPKLRKVIKSFVYSVPKVDEEKVIKAVEAGRLSYLDVQKFSTEIAGTEYVTIRTNKIDG